MNSWWIKVSVDFSLYAPVDVLEWKAWIDWILSKYADNILSWSWDESGSYWRPSEFISEFTREWVHDALNENNSNDDNDDGRFD